jgi:hypothetical protein
MGVTGKKLCGLILVFDPVMAMKGLITEGNYPLEARN